MLPAIQNKTPDGTPMFMPERLTEARKESGQSQRTLAERAGIKQPTLNQYERGKAQPSSGVASRLAKLLGKPMGYFYGESETAVATQDGNLSDNELWLMGLVVRLEAGEGLSAEEQIRFGQLMRQAVLDMAAKAGTPGAKIRIC